MIYLGHLQLTLLLLLLPDTSHIGIDVEDEDEDDDDADDAGDLLPGTGSVGDVVEEAARLEQLLRKPPVFQLLLPWLSFSECQIFSLVQKAMA